MLARLDAAGDRWANEMSTDLDVQELEQALGTMRRVADRLESIP